MMLQGNALIILFLILLSCYSTAYLRAYRRISTPSLPNQCILSKTQLKMSESIDDGSTKHQLRLSYAQLFAALPLVSISLPWLLNDILSDDGSQSSSMKRSVEIIALLLAKRIYLYSWAITTFKTVAFRSADLPGSLGQRFKVVNEELFSFLNINDKAQDEGAEEIKDSAYDALDNVPLATQVTVIPALLSVFLLTAYAVLYLGGSMQATIPNSSDGFSVIARSLASSIAPLFSIFTVSAVCALFTGNEIKALLDSTSQTFTTTTAKVRKIVTIF
jgi:hypothetical protein